jgi:uncharacterized protein
MALQVTALYAGLLGIVGLVLWGLVGQARTKTTVSLGDGGIKPLMEASRRHMNWVENVPFIVLLIAIAELNGGGKTWLHVMGLVLLIARVIHPFGINADIMNTWQRGVGAGGTGLVAAAAILTILWQWFSR